MVSFVTIEDGGTLCLARHHLELMIVDPPLTHPPVLPPAGETSPQSLEALATDRRCVRVGVTQNRESRIRDYNGRHKQLFVAVGITHAQMVFAYYHGHIDGYMKAMEQRLPDIAKRHGTGLLNSQERSNYPYKWRQGWLYVILAGRDPAYDLEQGIVQPVHHQPVYPPPQPDARIPWKTLLLVFLLVAVVAAAAAAVFLWIL